MTIDWGLVATLGAPVLSLFVGAGLDRVIERRARLIAYYGHVSAFRLTAPPNTVIHTHSVVLKNTGRRPAEDIEISHNYLPDFNVFPDLEHTRFNLPGGGAEIRIPKLVPNEQVNISYLYFPPVTFDQVNGPIRHSEGFARGINVLPTPQPARWVTIARWGLMLAGVLGLFYALVELFRELIS